MSEKKRRDITLGEMQDECKQHLNRAGCCKCLYMEICSFYESVAPSIINLSDPPRFNEAQTDSLRELWNIGAKYVSRDMCYTAMFVKKPAQVKNGQFRAYDKDEEIDSMWILPNTVLQIKIGELVDLAELLGKDAL